MGADFGHVGKEDVEGGRCGEAVEPCAFQAVILYVQGVSAAVEDSVPGPDLGGRKGQQFEAFPPVAEGDDGDDVRLHPLVQAFFALLGGKAVGDGDMPAEVPVYPSHHGAENLAVGGCVLDFLLPDVAVDHLVYDGVLNLFLREVMAGAYPEAEVISAHSKARDAFCPESALAHIRGGIAEFDGNLLQFSVEHESVVLVEFCLNIWNRCLHSALQR